MNYVLAEIQDAVRGAKLAVYIYIGEHQFRRNANISIKSLKTDSVNS